MGVQLVKEASSKTNDDVGDGTTSSTVVAQAMIRNGFRVLTAGANPLALKRGIEMAVNGARDEIRSMARPVDGKEQIEQIAILSAHDPEMGELIADVLDRVGPHGIVTVEESKGLSYEVDFVEGMQVDRGYLSPYFATNQDRMITEIENPYILVTSSKISAVSELLPVLEQVSQVSRDFVLIAEDVDGEALATLVVNKLRGTLNCLAIKAPAFGDRRKAILEDMSILFGCQVISEDVGRSLDSVTVADLGRCGRVISDKDNTTFVSGGGDQESIQARISQINSQAEDTTSDYDREKLEERAAKLCRRGFRPPGWRIDRDRASREEAETRKTRFQPAEPQWRKASFQVAGPLCSGRYRLRLPRSRRRAMRCRASTSCCRASEEPIKVISANSGLSGEVVLHRVSAQEGRLRIRRRERAVRQHVRDGYRGSCEGDSRRAGERSQCSGHGADDRVAHHGIESDETACPVR